MRILITNDDGIYAPGLAVLEAIARHLTADVWIVAPELDQSGTSHSLTLNDPLRIREVGRQHFAVRGTPTDCVIMGVRYIIPDQPPDLVLSGVNRGQNVAEDVTYSGTIAGAIEGTLLGIPSIALSQAYNSGARDEVRWSVAQRYGPLVIERVLQAAVPPGIVVNANFPDCEPDEVQGIAVTAQGKRNPGLLRVEARRDGRGNPYFWLAFQRSPFEPREGTDLWAMRHNQISLTPLKLDFTDHELLEEMRAAFR